MNLIGSRRTPEPAEADPQEALREVAEAALAALPKPLPDPLDEAQRAAVLREEATGLRERTEQARVEAEQQLTAVRAEAARLVAEAERHAQAVTNEGRHADARARQLEDTAGFWHHAGLLRAQAAETAQQAAQLAAQREEHQATAAALDARLAELTLQQRRAEAGLSLARQDGDVDAAAEARRRLDGLGEVVPVLVAQRDQARAAAAAIGGENDSAQYAQALERARSLLAERERVLDRADPRRVGRRREADPLGEWARSAQEHPEILAEVAGRIGPKAPAVSAVAASLPGGGTTQVAVKRQ